MKAKSTASISKQTVTIRDLKTSRNPKGGACVVDTSAEEQRKHNYKGVVTLIK